MPDIYFEGALFNYHWKIEVQPWPFISCSVRQTRSNFKQALTIHCSGLLSYKKNLHFKKFKTNCNIGNWLWFFTLRYRVARKFHFCFVIKDRILRICRWICRNGYNSYLQAWDKLVKIAWFLRTNEVPSRASYRDCY